MLTSKISRIWLLGLVLFAATPFLIAAQSQPTEAPAQVEQQQQPAAQEQVTAPVKDSLNESTIQNVRAPATAPLASGK